MRVTITTRLGGFAGQYAGTWRTRVSGVWMETVRSVEMGSTRYDEIGEGGWLHGMGGCRQLDARVVVSLREHQLVRIPILRFIRICADHTWCFAHQTFIGLHCQRWPCMRRLQYTGCAGFACYACLLFTYELELLIIYILATWSTTYI